MTLDNIAQSIIEYNIGPGVLLGNTTKLPSPSEGDLVAVRLTRYVLQNVSSDILPKERVAKCLKLVVPGAPGVKVLYSPKVKRAHYGNLTVCGSVWACPVCSVKVSERRRLEVYDAINTWPGTLIMAAFTLQHQLQEPLCKVKDRLYSAYGRLLGGKGWQVIKARWGIVGMISSSEVTWGAKSGWHPHKHALLFCSKKLSARQVKQVEREVSARFRAILDSLGGYGSPEVSVKFQIGSASQKASKLTDYVFKWGLDYELTKSQVKKAYGENYSPFELLGWASLEGELQPVELFREYYGNYKGSHQLNYSRGLREILGLKKDKSDLELAEEQDQEAIELAVLTRNIWKEVCRQNKRGELLEVASSGELEDVKRFIVALGFPL